MPGDSGAQHTANWTLVVPLKPLNSAKSRLSIVANEALRPALALAFALDTVTAALRCEVVQSVMVVTDDPLAQRELSTVGAKVTADTPGRGLNAALIHGAALVRRKAPDMAVAALNADLPALRPAELRLTLEEARRAPRSFLADATGEGTTLLTALPGVPLAPAFGVGSREAHLASGAREIELTNVVSARRDVDTADDLEVAFELGVGPHTLRTYGGSPS